MKELINKIINKNHDLHLKVKDKYLNLYVS